MTWRRIRLELGETDALHDGSRMHGYDLIAPLDHDGRIEEAAWRADEARATVRRFWEGEPETRGRLTREPDGALAFSLDGKGGVHHLDAQTFKTGDVVSVTDATGAAQPFRVAAVRVLAIA